MKFQVLDREVVRKNVHQFIAMSRRTIKNEYWDEKHFMVELPGKWRLSFCVISETSQIVAFLIASQKQESVHIHKFVVDIPSQHKGIGRLMINHLKGLSTMPISLKVADANDKAIDFYKKNGFLLTSYDRGMYTMICRQK